jgi:hypothetical protein
MSSRPIGLQVTTGSPSAAFVYDVAISAVAYDAMLVAELADSIGPRLRAPACWRREIEIADAGTSTHPTNGDADAMSTDASRIALVLHQRLWGRDPATIADDGLLRRRLRARPKSLCVVTLDDSPLPDWLRTAPQCDFAQAGIAGTVSFVLDAIVDAGGSLRPPFIQQEIPPDKGTRWPEGPAPFLKQPRAESALRRELDALAHQLAPLLETEQRLGENRVVEVLALPHRLIVRLDGIGISFSWVPDRSGAVGDGRLLVIEWHGVVSELRGASALRSATPTRERVYRPEGTDPDSWRWRVDGPNGRACSTSNLAAEWVASAALACIT